MSLNDRLDFEKKKISAFELFTKTCFNCKYWLYKVSNTTDYCHKCINNPKVPIRSEFGYNLETLFDYYKSSTKVKNVFCQKKSQCSHNPVNIPVKKKIV